MKKQANVIPTIKCTCGCKFSIRNYYNRDVGDNPVLCPACKSEMDLRTTFFAPLTEGNPCELFEEDPFICFSDGTPKGQCLCGYKEEDHTQGEV
jgi:hypothetical protein